MGWRARGWANNYPGRGPFSHLPPWERPGWRYGRGACWYLYGPYGQYNAPEIPAEEEKEILSQQAEIIEQEIKAMQENLKKIQEKQRRLTE